MDAITSGGAPTGGVSPTVVVESRLAQQSISPSGAPASDTGSQWIVRQRMLRDLAEINPELEREFNALAEQWRAETGLMSLVSEQANNFSYHQIIGMGKEALPLIFRELKETTSDWFWALRAITRTNVDVENDALGDVDKVAKAWLAWGEAHGYIAK